MKYLKFAINVLMAIGKAVAILLRFLRLIKKKEETPDKKKTVKMPLLFLLCLVLMLAGCTKNFYDEELRDEIIVQKHLIIEQSMLFAKDSNGAYLFTINYLAGLYRLALLGEGTMSEDEIADAIEIYKKHLTVLRGE